MNYFLNKNCIGGILSIDCKINIQLLFQLSYRIKIVIFEKKKRSQLKLFDENQMLESFHQMSPDIFDRSFLVTKKKL